MRGVLTAMAVAGAVLSTGCLAGFRHPLDSAGRGFIDDGLLGAWVCQTDDDGQTIHLTFVDFDGRQYLLESDDPKEGRNSHRVIGTRLEESTFVSVRAVAPKAEDEWTILQYAFGEAHRLTLSMIDPDAFEDVRDDAAAVRERLAQRLDDPEVKRDILSCTRSASPKEQ